MATMNVADFAGTSTAVEKPLTPGQALRAASRPVTLASEDITALTATQTVSGTVTVNGIATTAYDRGAGPTTSQTARVTLASEQIETGKYEAFPNTVSTTTMLGGAGATGDFLSTVTIVPETLNPGSISIKDGSGTAIVIFAGGTASVLSLVPFTVNLGYTSTSGGWQIVTGSGGNVHGVCGGNFT